MLDAADLGFSPDDEQCQELAEALGSPPPWSLASLKALFDQQYTGWDAAPGLGLSSPLSRLRGLSEVFACNASNGQTEGDALRELGQEVKHAQIRLLCPRPASGGILQDECMFLLFVLGQVGDRLLVEREARRSERQVAEIELSRMRDDLRKHWSEAIVEAKEQTKTQLDESMQEAEVHRQRADKMEKELNQLQSQERYVAEMENRIEVLESEAMRSTQLHGQMLEELCEAKAQRAALVVAHEESKGALDDMQRRIDGVQKASKVEIEEGEAPLPSNASAKPSACLPPEVKLADNSNALTNRAFSSGARTALSLQAIVSFDVSCRPAFLAWRCARLQALRDKAGNSIMEVVNTRKDDGDGRCCCSADLGTCCRQKWLDGVLKILFEERSRSAQALQDEKDISPEFRRHYVFSFGILVALFCLMLLLKSENSLLDGPWHDC